MTDAARPVSVAREGRVAVVTFDRGDGINALSSDLMLALTEAALALSREDDLSAVVLHGAGGAFSLGFDLEEGRRRWETKPGIDERRRAAKIGRDLCRAWAGLEPMTFCAVEGWCVGGGAALAAHCDLRVAGRSARFYLPEVERGLNLSWGAVPRLAALVGPARAKRLAALAERLDAPTAEAWGLVDRIAEDGGALGAARDWAETAAGLPPLALRMCKAQAEAAGHAFDRAVSFLDADQFVLSSLTEDHAESLAAFFEKRPPRYEGR
ncbi:MAG TPA: enoyl-CoA hydratase/isomerase family protein [Paracoccaceae bacterium]|nr:enoyl-CoA hydratase/isomerase family protein [Paracoccaceae bacterium]